jgi:hypothetical protein
MIWSLDRAHERTEFMEPLPEVEIIDSCAVDCFCSRECLDAGLAAAMARQRVPIPASPACIGPVETCAVCRKPVDMTQFHLALGTSQCQELETIGMQPVWYEPLAVVCTTCRPLTGAAAWQEPAVANMRTAPQGEGQPSD